MKYILSVLLHSSHITANLGTVFICILQRGRLKNFADPKSLKSSIFENGLIRLKRIHVATTAVLKRLENWKIWDMIGWMLTYDQWMVCSCTEPWKVCLDLHRVFSTKLNSMITYFYTCKQTGAVCWQDVKAIINWTLLWYNTNIQVTQFLNRLYMPCNHIGYFNTQQHANMTLHMHIKKKTLQKKHIYWYAMNRV